MSLITVNVTRDHITLGERLRFNKCPVALALTDLGLGQGGAMPSFLSIGEVWYESPCLVTDFIVQFDATGFGNPFSFVLNTTSGYPSTPSWIARM